MKDATTSSWYQRISLRTRMLLIASAAIIVVLATGGILLLALLRAELIDTADDAGEDTAINVARLAEQGTLPRELAETEEIASAIQVVREGVVISGTPNALGQMVFPLAEQQPGDVSRADREQLPFDGDGPYRVIALGTESPYGDVTVFVAVDVEDVDDAVSIAAKVGGLGLVALVVTLSGVLWVVIGRTLAPVSAIQTRADAITGSELHRRVPEPVGRDEISDLARTINAMLGRLEASAKRQESFVADAAHELRSPIASLQARLETVLNADGPTDKGVFRDLLHETTRMGRLVDHLLLLARSDAGTISAARVPVDLDDIIREAVSTAGPTVIPITTSEVEPVQVLGQQALLEHVVTNLLENAERYAGSSIDVSLHANAKNAILTVDDDGPGIPPDQREDVLQRFVRVDGSRERGTGGTGLGLAIVSEIVRIHDGEIEVADSPSGGARLRVLLPLP
ncbi:ATP-binding protein [Aeromicrobium sp.]|uniref:sensor histidine kinase n=1 Tax=Aeromicrobium sp. TaxID=1871063 RepID=UPI003D6BC8C3